jgi:hypothetical protein
MYLKDVLSYIRAYRRSPKQIPVKKYLAPKILSPLPSLSKPPPRASHGPLSPHGPAVEAMASSSRILARLPPPQLRLGARAGALPKFASFTTTSSLPKSTFPSRSIARRPRTQQQTLLPVSRQFGRGYADVAPVKKRRRFRVFRWLWRLTYLSMLGGVGYIVYDGYVCRNPEEQEQFKSDPSKKTLVVLGKCMWSATSQSECLLGWDDMQLTCGFRKVPAGAQ